MRFGRAEGGAAEGDSERRDRADASYLRKKSNIEDGQTGGTRAKRRNGETRRWKVVGALLCAKAWAARAISAASEGLKRRGVGHRLVAISVHA
mmetsp:Transcript_14339/g.27985  ORF Transcript_14339/g.27985 Transcript_14339/m.27985 type:complete len:93 (+) Transcript_14339:166-444(+)|eukprot:6206664-Pleurochrysis_carterae.AAC.3